MVKNFDNVGGGTVRSHFNSSLGQNRCVLLNKSKDAFSIAEAFIMLTIVSVALAAAAPMITKQIKHNNLSNVQTNLLGREINQAENRISATNANIREIIGAGRTAEQYADYIQNLENRISALDGNANLQKLINGSYNNDVYDDIEALQSQLNNKVSSSDLSTQMSRKADNATVIQLEQQIKELREQVQNSAIPIGTVAFFNLPTCPSGWSAVSQSWNGRFPRFAGSYTVLSYNTTNKAYNATGTAQTLNVGATQEDAIRNIYGVVGSLYGGTLTNENRSLRTGAFTPYNRTYTDYGGLGLLRGGDTIWNVSFSAQNVVPSSIENRPKSVALLGCVKK